MPHDPTCPHTMPHAIPRRRYHAAWDTMPVTFSTLTSACLATRESQTNRRIGRESGSTGGSARTFLKPTSEAAIMPEHSKQPYSSQSCSPSPYHTQSTRLPAGTTRRNRCAIASQHAPRPTAAELKRLSAGSACTHARPHAQCVCAYTLVPVCVVCVCV